MDIQGFLCGLPLDRLRKRAQFNFPNVNRIRHNFNRQGKNRHGHITRSNSKIKKKHLPVGTGEHTVGCVDLMTGHSEEGSFIRLYYPTFPANVLVRLFRSLFPSTHSRW